MWARGGPHSHKVLRVARAHVLTSTHLMHKPHQLLASYRAAPQLLKMSRQICPASNSNQDSLKPLSSRRTSHSLPNLQASRQTTHNNNNERKSLLLIYCCATLSSVGLASECSPSALELVTLSLTDRGQEKTSARQPRLTCLAQQKTDAWTLPQLHIPYRDGRVRQGQQEPWCYLNHRFWMNKTLSFQKPKPLAAVRPVVPSSLSLLSSLSLSVSFC